MTVDSSDEKVAPLTEASLFSPSKRRSVPFPTPSASPSAPAADPAPSSKPAPSPESDLFKPKTTSTGQDPHPPSGDEGPAPAATAERPEPVTAGPADTHDAVAAERPATPPALPVEEEEPAPAVAADELDWEPEIVEPVDIFADEATGEPSAPAAATEPDVAEAPAPEAPRAEAPPVTPPRTPDPDGTTTAAAAQPPAPYGPAASHPGAHLDEEPHRTPGTGRGDEEGSSEPTGEAPGEVSHAISLDLDDLLVDEAGTDDYFATSPAHMTAAAATPPAQAHAPTPAQPTAAAISPATTPPAQAPPTAPADPDAAHTDEAPHHPADAPSEGSGGDDLPKEPKKKKKKSKGKKGKADIDATTITPADVLLDPDAVAIPLSPAAHERGQREDDDAPFTPGDAIALGLHGRRALDGGPEPEDHSPAAAKLRPTSDYEVTDPKLNAIVERARNSVEFQSVDTLSKIHPRAGSNVARKMRKASKSSNTSVPIPVVVLVLVLAAGLSYLFLSYA